jgi:hypothetical protein
MALTELQEKWIAEVLGVDLGQVAPAPARTKATPAARLAVVIANQSDRSLRLIKAENDGGHFEPAPPERIAPKKKVSLAAIDTGAQGGTLIYQLEAKEGAADEPDQLPWWHMRWKAAPGGQVPAADATLEPEAKGYSPSAGAGKDSLAFMLSGASTATQSTSQASPGAGRRRIDVTLVNRSDQWLKYWGADKMKATFEKKPPDELKPGASATFAIFGSGGDEIHFGLLYSIVPTADAKADAAAPKWTPHFDIPAGTTVMVPNSDIVPGIDGLKSSENPSATAVSFVLSGTSARSVPQVPLRPQDVEQRIPVTLTNDSDRTLLYWGQDKMVVTFEQRPPKSIRPGQSFTFAIRGKRGTEISFGLMYSIVEKETDKPDGKTPKWAPYFRIPPAAGMIAHAHISNPGVAGLKAGGWPDKDGALFVLSGKAVASAQPPQVPMRPQDVQQRIPVTFTNNSNMVLRYGGADKMVVTFDRKPPYVFMPGQSVGFAVTGKRGTEISFGLMYSVLASETEKPDDRTPTWWPHFRVLPTGQMIADAQVVPGMGGLKGSGRPEKEGALFVLAGQWVKDQELETPVTIRNLTPYTLRLVESSSASGRFDPVAPAQIAAGATATFASLAKVESDQKVVYELQPPDGAKKPRKRKLWTMTWRSRPGNRPSFDDRLENVEGHSGARGLDGDDGVRFELEIKGAAGSE